MNTSALFDSKYRRPTLIVFFVVLTILAAAMNLGRVVQSDYGNVEVSNVYYENFNGIAMRAKLFRPLTATSENQLPGVVYIHGYQNNRETGDAYCIELARRGFVVLNIDAIGRGNSGIPNDINDSDFDPTYGAATSFEYLQSLPYVDPERVGMVGHSLGAEMAYNVALQNPDVKALVISGFGYTLEADTDTPKNMLMIFGRWDEYRARMTETKDFAAEWMTSPQTQQVFPVGNPQFGQTYGDFAAGTARQVFMPDTIHIGESHDKASIAAAVTFLRSALNPPDALWVDPMQQIWPVKEWSTLVALLAGVWVVLPLGLMLLQTRYFKSLQGAVEGAYAVSTKAYFKYVAINGLLMLLYLPLVLVLFAIHIYVVPIDKVFPMMMVNGIVFWFVVTNLIGCWVLRGWLKREQSNGLTLTDLGISDQPDKFAIDRDKLLPLMGMVVTLFAFVVALEFRLENIFNIDYRFIFPFASDLTFYRFLMFLEYLPFLFVGFLLMGNFLHGQLRPPQRDTWWKTFLSWSGSNIFAVTSPLILLLLIQYVSLLAFGVVPFIGPGGSLVSFVLNLFHIVGVLVIVTPISTWFYQLTGRPWVGALLNAMLVAWMFASSQVIAPIPL
ncbi:MAG: acetylxylan esterase [Anaerolineales bacterium]|nr:acetylxylan esterase [Anaerolineales bacterium]